MIVSMAYLTAQFFDALRMRDLREPGRMQVEPLHDNWDLRSLEGTIPFSRICPGTYIIEAITEDVVQRVAIEVVEWRDLRAAACRAIGVLLIM